MQENPKPPRSMFQVAHVAARTSFTTAGASILGAIATAEETGPLHSVFAAGAVGSLLTMTAALVVNSCSDRPRYRRSEGLTGQALSAPAPVPARAAVAFAVPIAVPVAVPTEDKAEQVVPALAEPTAAQAWRVA
jgi:hypothetical protein